MHLSQIVRESSLLFPRLGIKSISIVEIGKTGFGDRLRGIALALFLSSHHRVDTIYYKESEQESDTCRKSAFPFKMCDLLQLKGIAFISGSPPPAERTLKILHDSAYGTKLQWFGAKHLKRLEPKETHIIDKLDAIGVDRKTVGLHIRATDAVDSTKYKLGAKSVDKSTLENLKSVASSLQTNKIFLSSDNEVSRNIWIAILIKSGFEPLFNSHVQWKKNELRQTGSDDMLIDFFGLARCSRIVRNIPSEFSRIAAWKAGNKLRYLDLC